MNPLSPRLTNTVSGLSVSSWKLRSAFSSSAVSPWADAGVPASNAATTRFSSASSASSGLALLGRLRLLQPRLDLRDAVRHDLQVGEEQLLAEPPQLVGEVGAGEPVEDDDDAVGLAEDAEPAGVVLALVGHEAGGVEELRPRRR